MAISVDWLNKLVLSTSSIPDIVAFKDSIRDLEDDAVGVLYEPIITYKKVDLGGGAYFHAVDFINGYQLKFPTAGSYSIIGNIGAAIVPVAGVFVDRTKAAAFATVAGGGGGGGTAPTAVENADAVWAKVLASGSTADATVSTTKTETTAVIATQGAHTTALTGITTTQDEHTAGLDAIRGDIAAIPPAPTPPAAVDIAAAVMGSTVEGTYTLDETLRLVASVLVGTVTGAGSGVETFIGLDLVTPRVVSTVDATGNRTSVVLDGAG